MILLEFLTRINNDWNLDISYQHVSYAEIMAAANGSTWWFCSPQGTVSRFVAASSAFTSHRQRYNSQVRSIMSNFCQNDLRSVGFLHCETPTRVCAASSWACLFKDIDRIRHSMFCAWLPWAFLETCRCFDDDSRACCSIDTTHR